MPVACRDRLNTVRGQMGQKARLRDAVLCQVQNVQVVTGARSSTVASVFIMQLVLHYYDEVLSTA
jgi:hypothetical protein